MVNKKKDFYPLVLDDGGRNYSRRPAQINDCTVRSFSILSGWEYDDVYDILAEAGRMSGQGFDNSTWLRKKKGLAFGGKFTRIEVVETSSRPELTPFNFGKYFPKGRYLLETYNHVWAYVDGKHRDLWRVSQHGPLYGAWKFKIKNK